MPAPLKLLDAFQKGELRTIRIATGNAAKPDMGKKWLLITGRIYHITGTDSVLWVQPVSGNQGVNAVTQTWKTVVQSTVGNEFCPIFNTEANVEQSQWHLIVISDTENIRLSAGATAYVLIVVLEW